MGVGPTGRGWGEGVVGNGEEGVWLDRGESGERSEGDRVWTHSATSVTEDPTL